MSIQELIAKLIRKSLEEAGKIIRARILDEDGQPLAYWAIAGEEMSYE